MNLPFIADPEARAQHADAIAGRRVERAQRLMNTQEVKAAVDRRKATTHALLALQLRQARENKTGDTLA